VRFRSDPAQIRGSIAPVVTPFDSDGAVDLDALARLVDWQIESGSHGISVLGSTGEPSSQSVDERRQVLERAARAVSDRVPFFPGTGSAHLGETLELTAEAERLGADAALVITPYYSRPTQAGLVEWYSTIAREFPSLPIVVYNVPVRTAVDIHPETVGRLRRAHDNIVGIKETTRDFEHASYVLNECGRDFLVYCGIELLCYPMLAIGGAGHLSCVANVAPRPCAELYDAFAGGDLERALELHYELHPLVEMAFVETNPGPVKWAMERLGILASGGVRPPLASPSDASRERIAGILSAVGLLEAPAATEASR
jgi:4-hydroxy-tetrahydrodipicolinate synthase